MSCRVTRPVNGAIPRPSARDHSDRHGSQKHNPRIPPRHFPMAISSSSEKWCRIITPARTSAQISGSSTSKSPRIQDTASGKPDGRGRRSMPETGIPGKRRANARHKRPSPAPISTMPPASDLPANVLRTQRTFPIRALIRRRSERLRTASGSRKSRWSRISGVRTLRIAIFALTA